MIGRRAAKSVATDMFQNAVARIAQEDFNTDDQRKGVAWKQLATIAGFSMSAAWASPNPDPALGTNLSTEQPEEEDIQTWVDRLVARMVNELGPYIDDYLANGGEAFRITMPEDFDPIVNYEVLNEYDASGDDASEAAAGPVDVTMPTTETTPEEEIEEQGEITPPASDPGDLPEVAEVEAEEETPEVDPEEESAEPVIEYSQEEADSEEADPDEDDGEEPEMDHPGNLLDSVANTAAEVKAEAVVDYGEVVNDPDEPEAPDPKASDPEPVDYGEVVDDPMEPTAPVMNPFAPASQSAPVVQQPAPIVQPEQEVPEFSINQEPAEEQPEVVVNPYLGPQNVEPLPGLTFDEAVEELLSEPWIVESTKKVYRELVGLWRDGKGEEGAIKKLEAHLQTLAAAGENYEQTYRDTSGRDLIEPAPAPVVTPAPEPVPVAQTGIREYFSSNSILAQPWIDAGLRNVYMSGAMYSYRYQVEQGTSHIEAIESALNEMIKRVNDAFEMSVRDGAVDPVTKERLPNTQYWGASFFPWPLRIMSQAGARIKASVSVSTEDIQLAIVESLGMKFMAETQYQSGIGANIVISFFTDPSFCLAMSAEISEAILDTATPEDVTSFIESFAGDLLFVGMKALCDEQIATDEPLVRTGWEYNPEPNFSSADQGALRALDGSTAIDVDAVGETTFMRIATAPEANDNPPASPAGTASETETIGTGGEYYRISSQGDFTYEGEPYKLGVFLNAWFDADEVGGFGFTLGNMRDAATGELLVSKGDMDDFMKYYRQLNSDLQKAMAIGSSSQIHDVDVTDSTTELADALEYAAAIFDLRVLADKPNIEAGYPAYKRPANSELEELKNLAASGQPNDWKLIDTVLGQVPNVLSDLAGFDDPNLLNQALGLSSSGNPIDAAQAAFVAFHQKSNPGVALKETRMRDVSFSPAALWAEFEPQFAEALNMTKAKTPNQRKGPAVYNDDGTWERTDSDYAFSSSIGLPRHRKERIWTQNVVPLLDTYDRLKDTSASIKWPTRMDFERVLRKVKEDVAQWTREDRSSPDPVVADVPVIDEPADGIEEPDEPVSASAFKMIQSVARRQLDVDLKGIAGQYAAARIRELSQKRVDRLSASLGIMEFVDNKESLMSAGSVIAMAAVRPPRN